MWRNGVATLLGVPEGGTTSTATGVSADGSVVVGGWFSASSWFEGGFVWRQATGFQAIPALWANGWARPDKVSDDGDVIIGSCGTPNEQQHAVRWRTGGPPEDLGVLPGLVGSWANGLSADGRVIVGFCGFGGDPRAFMYTDQTGMVDLTRFVSQNVVDLQGRTLLECTAVSADGTTLVGHGIDSPASSNGWAWRLHIPGWLCYANCDTSTAPPVLNAGDFVCFLNHFAAADEYANCDGSTAAPVVNALDFMCFIDRFAAGCP
jgi:probable HAF family extracellular repeat protein